MKRYLPLILLSLLTVGPALPAYAFEAGPGWPAEQRPVTYTINQAGSDDLTMVQLEELFARSFDTWTSVPCADLQVVYEGNTDTGIAYDEEHTMAFQEENWAGGSMVLGATLTNLLSNDPRRITVDILFNGDTITWQVGGGGSDLTTIDPQSVFTHEIGHMLGLGHTLDDGSATMAAAYLPDLSQRTLSHDDKWGICTLYPRTNNGGECDPMADDCPDGSACGPQGEYFFCIEDRDGLEAPCSHSSINCQDMCVYTSADLESGFCTRVCSNDEECEPDGVCEPFGGTQVCRLKPEVMDELNADILEEADVADDPGLEIGIVESTMDMAPDDTAADQGEVLDSAPMEGDGGDDGCGCSTVRNSENATPLAVFGALLILGFALFRRRS